MYRCLNVSPTGYYASVERQPSPRDIATAQLLERIREIHYDSSGIIGAPRMHEYLQAGGLEASLNCIARFGAANGIYGWPRQKGHCIKRTSVHPASLANHLERDFSAQESETKWDTEVTEIGTLEGELYLCVVLDLFCNLIVGWSRHHRQSSPNRIGIW